MNKQNKIKLGLALFLAAFLFASSGFGQDTVKFRGKYYEVTTTPIDQYNNAYFIMLDDSTRGYLAQLDGWERPRDNGDGTATYKHERYTINIGSRGGRYIISKSGSKHYLPKLIND